jgi:colicin import membrane protein
VNTAAQRLEFAPPPTPGTVRALGLAVIAHILLVAALTWGVHWKRDAVTLTAEAELWSAMPRQAAPQGVELPAATAVEKPVPVPEIARKVPDADIVTTREKRRLELADEERAEDKKRRDDKKKAEAKQAEVKQAEQKQAELAAKRKEALAAQEAVRKQELQRQENIKRMAGLAGAAGPATSTGTTQQSSGPSPSYPGRIRARIKPNIVFTEDIAGNPTAEVEVRTSPDGTIVSRKLVKASGVTAWDEAVLKAIDKTEVLPRDVDGRVPTPLVISFRPKD